MGGFQLAKDADLVDQAEDLVVQGQNLVSTERWPPDNETPQEEWYGDHGDEQIAPYSPSLQRLPLRRRSVDPWFQISQPELTKIGGRMTLRLHVQRLVKSGYSDLILCYRYPSVNFFERVTDNFVNRDLRNVVNGAVIEVPVNALWGQGARAPEAVEFFIVVRDSNYTREAEDGAEETAPLFKVSNSVIMGQPFPLMPPREWSEQETQRLLAPVRPF